MQKWEYKVIDGWPSESDLDRLGDQGWELVAVAVDGSGEGFKAAEVHAYLKRPS